MATTTTATTARITFNHGFWDAVSDREHGRSQKWLDGHFNAAYLAGYRAGWQAAPDGPQSSDRAWAVHSRQLSLTIER